MPGNPLVKVLSVLAGGDLEKKFEAKRARRANVRAVQQRQTGPYGQPVGGLRPPPPPGGPAGSGYYPQPGGQPWPAPPNRGVPVNAPGQPGSMAPVPSVPPMPPGPALLQHQPTQRVIPGAGRGNGASSTGTGLRPVSGTAPSPADVMPTGAVPAGRMPSPPVTGTPDGRPSGTGYAPPVQPGRPPVELGQPAGSTSAAEPAQADAVWQVVSAPRRDPWWLTARRWLVLVVAAVLVLTGGVTIAGKIIGWLRPAPAPVAAGPSTGDTQWDGAASVAAVDYLSWDQNDKADRQTAMTRIAAANTTIDGWNGTGRQWADSPAAIGIVHNGPNTAVVTVQVRVVPFTATNGSPAASSPPSSDAGSNVASGPNLSATGWTEQPARWVNLAVPLGVQNGQIVVTATPALVGSPPTTAAGPALPSNTSAGDTSFAQSTQGTITTLLQAYASGSLSYARATGTTFAGLNGAATFGQLGQWQVAPLAQGADPTQRVGDVTVTWTLTGGAGQLSCSYRVQLDQQDGRWYLGNISAETQEVSS